MSSCCDSRVSAALVREICTIAGLVVMVVAPLRLDAAYQDYSPTAVAMLPTYCKCTQLFREKVPGATNPAEIQRWYQLLGPTYNALHHYCWGLQAVHDATFLARDKQFRAHMLNVSIREFDYVIDRAPPDYVLMPEFLFKKGESQVKLGQGHIAVVQFQRAIELKPDYWPPYAAMSDLYKSVGDLPKAREWVDKGLSVAPDAKPLLARQAELGGTQGKRAVSPSPNSSRPATPSAAELPPSAEPAAERQEEAATK